MLRDQSVTHSPCAGLSHCAATASIHAIVRILPLIVVLAMSSPVRADDAAQVTSAIRSVLDGRQPFTTSDGTPDWYTRLAGVVVIGPMGSPPETRGDLEKNFSTCTIADLFFKLDAVTPTIDTKRGFAWFHVPLSVEAVCMAASYVVPSSSEKLRASGILVRDKAAWKLVALVLSRQLTDAQLYKLSPGIVVNNGGTVVDSVAAQTAATWFHNHELLAGKSPGDVIVSGTDPREMAIGAAALGLVKAWEMLHLHASSIHTSAFANGQIALLQIDTWFQVPKQKSVALMLYAIVTLDETTKAWRWLSLQFATDLAPRPPIVTPDASGIECPHGNC